MLRIPKDAAKMLKSYYNTQIERAQKIKNPLSFLDWVTMGMVSGAWQGMQQRADKMLKNPSAYNVGNWLTMGLLDTAKGAINPDEPLSLEHWLNSAELAGTVVGGYKAAAKDIGRKIEKSLKKSNLDGNIRTMPSKVKINQGKQDKHIVGTNNYNLSLENGIKRSILVENPQNLLDEYGGHGTIIAENKEWVDFGKIIGRYYDIDASAYVNTTKGIIHYDSKGGAHIVPANPNGVR